MENKFLFSGKFFVGDNQNGSEQIIDDLKQAIPIIEKLYDNGHGVHIEDIYVCPLYFHVDKDVKIKLETKIKLGIFNEQI